MFEYYVTLLWQKRDTSDRKVASDEFWHTEESR